MTSSPHLAPSETIEVLLDSGADIEVGGLAGTDQTPLHRVAGRDHAELAQLLLDRGADPCRRVSRGEAFRGMTALDIAREGGSTEAERVLEAPTSRCEA